MALPTGSLIVLTPEQIEAVSKKGDNVNGTLDFSDVPANQPDLKHLSNSTAGGINLVRSLRGGKGDVIFHELIERGYLRIRTGVNADNEIYYLTNAGVLWLKSQIIPGDYLNFNERYLLIGNPATSAKKLDKPSRIAGQVFSGEGEDISAGLPNTADLESGWWKCGDTGLIRQWGVINRVDGGEDVITPVTFPRPFDNKCFGVTLTLMNEIDPVRSSTANIRYNNLTKLGFDYRSNGSLEKTCFYEAVGK
ncbi:TPA: hypothetical protein ACKREO_002532 [Providencia stuartii]